MSDDFDLYTERTGGTERSLGRLWEFEIFLTDGTDDTDFYVADYNISQEPRMALVMESMVM